MIILGFIVANLFGAGFFCLSFLLLSMCGWGTTSKWEPYVVFIAPMCASILVFYFTWSGVLLEVKI